MLKKRVLAVQVLILILVLFVSVVYAQSSISTVAELDIYGRAKLTHIISSDYDDLQLKVYSPESLDINQNVKYTIEGDALKIKGLKSGAKIIYLSDTLAKKDGAWKISYTPFQEQSFKLVLPFSAGIIRASPNNFQSKEKIGQVIEWSSTQDSELEYGLGYVSEGFDWFKLVLCILVIVLAGVIIWFLFEPLKPISPKLFLNRVTGESRIFRAVVLAILIRVYEQKVTETDQAQIRGTLSKEQSKSGKDVDALSGHKSEINKIVHEKLNFLVKINESKIRITEEAKKEFGLEDNYPIIIKELRKRFYDDIQKNPLAKLGDEQNE